MFVGSVYNKSLSQLDEVDYVRIENNASLRHIAVDEEPAFMVLHREDLKIKNNCVNISKSNYTCLVGLMALSNLQSILISNNSNIEELNLCGLSKMTKIAILSNSNLTDIKLGDMPLLEKMSVCRNVKLTCLVLPNKHCLNSAIISGNTNLKKMRNRHKLKNVKFLNIRNNAETVQQYTKINGKVQFSSK